MSSGHQHNPTARFSIPPGFVEIDAWPDFVVNFGQVYVNTAARLIGFHVAKHHTNPIGVCSGGSMATFADMQLLAVMPRKLTSDNHWPTVSLSMDYVASAPLGSWVEAEVTLVKRTKTMVFTQALIRVAANAVARSNAIYRYYEAGQTP